MRISLHFTLLFLLSSWATRVAAARPIPDRSAEPTEETSRPQQFTTKKQFSGPIDGWKPYGLVDIRHALTQYYGEENQRLRTEPAVYTRLQVGARLYGDKLDVSAALGAVKTPATQAIYQKRPEVIVDFYTLKSDSINLLWYQMIQVPVRDRDRDPTEYGDADLYDFDSRRGLDASVYTTGLAPVAKLEFPISGGKLAFRAGVDAWTRMYSKPLYVDDRDRQNHGLSLVSVDEDPVDKPFEDRALRYTHQESLGLGWTPGFSTKLQGDISSYIESRYIPKYFRDDSGSWDYEYKVEKVSFYRLRVTYDFSPTVALNEEIYYFMNGFFRENRVNDQRRYRNILRLAVKL